MPPRRKPPVELDETPPKPYIVEYNDVLPAPDALNSRHTSHSTITAQHQAQYQEQQWATEVPEFPPAPPPKLSLDSHSMESGPPTPIVNTPYPSYDDSLYRKEPIFLPQTTPGKPLGPRKLPDFDNSSPLTPSKSGTRGYPRSSYPDGLEQSPSKHGSTYPTRIQSFQVYESQAYLANGALDQNHEPQTSQSLGDRPLMTPNSEYSYPESPCTSPRRSAYEPYLFLRESPTSDSRSWYDAKTSPNHSREFYKLQNPSAGSLAFHNNNNSVHRNSYQFTADSSPSLTPRQSLDSVNSGFRIESPKAFSRSPTLSSGWKTPEEELGNVFEGNVRSGTTATASTIVSEGKPGPNSFYSDVGDYSLDTTNFPPPTTDFEMLNIKLVASNDSLGLNPPTDNEDEARLNGQDSYLRKKNEALPPRPLELPNLPFSAAALVSSQYKQCGTDFWNLSTLWSWCKFLSIWSQGSSILVVELEKAFYGLVKYHYIQREAEIPEHEVMVETAVAIVASLVEAGAIEDGSIMGQGTKDDGKEDPNDFLSLPHSHTTSDVGFNPSVSVSGVFTPLLPCYGCDKPADAGYRCYAPLCPLSSISDTKFDLTRLRTAEFNQWYTFWDVRKDEVERLGKDVVERQCSIFEILKLTYLMVADGERFVDGCGASFLRESPPLVPNADRFYEYCFGTVKALVEVMKRELLEPLVEIFVREGKFIKSSFSRFFINFVRDSKLPYLNYATYKVYVVALIDHELKDKKASRFARWYAQVDGAGAWAKFFKYINYIIYPIDVAKPFETILRLTPPTHTDYAPIARVLKALRRLNIRSDEMYYVSQNHQTLQKLRAQLYWKHVPKINLNLSLKNRKLVKHDVVYQNRLLGSDTTVDLILLDNYLLITEPTMKETLRLKVVERPIPMEYLVVEIKDEVEERPEIRQSPSYSLKLLKSSSTHSSLTAKVSEPQTVFSFKVRYAGEAESHTYYTKERQTRDTWRDVIVKAKTALFDRIRDNEPYRLRVLSDAAFACEEVVRLPLCAPGDPIMVALQEVYSNGKTESEGRAHEVGGDVTSKDSMSQALVLRNLVEERSRSIPRPLMTSRVNCAASFDIDGENYALVGLDYGVYMTPLASPREWKRILDLRSVRQIGVMPSFDLVLVLSDKSLSYYTGARALFGGAYRGTRAKAVGTKLLYKDIEAFKIGAYKNSTTLFLISHVRTKSNSKFRVLYPIRDPATDRFDSFLKDYIYKFVMQAECYGLSVFKSVFAVHTSKGFEVMSLDNLRPGSIPILPPASDNRELEQIRQKLNATVRAMGMFKLHNNQEFLLVYADFAIFTNPLGELSRGSMLNFRFRCSRINFYDNYLVLVCDEAVEVWAISDERTGSNKLVQVITGKDIRMLSGEDDKALRIVMAHPEVPGRQLVLEMVKNLT
ncbi:hypothetical protein BABINDRAFT_15584 [Babjeviella inositovora NRRL Y-12698]|uniref:CNH domain-containing protein n=1 Tax=Babjeviella inositovora NRRL Y-12698 TaxID=984486 RepID=A0A1E3QI18_9ASCO|nr:uncharacterized protein BABINDRAFT_15584 [Babjeviella inositovora NRRL Y-12698]ODQ77339.1 hypothetical protein BABINDRAFT_15584 [Babjeviella inositovora NRRL Y-12698]